MVAAPGPPSALVDEPPREERGGSPRPLGHKKAHEAQENKAISPAAPKAFHDPGHPGFLCPLCLFVATRRDQDRTLRAAHGRLRRERTATGLSALLRRGGAGVLNQAHPLAQDPRSHRPPGACSVHRGLRQTTLPGEAGCAAAATPWLGRKLQLRSSRGRGAGIPTRFVWRQQAGTDDTWPLRGHAQEMAQNSGSC